MDYQEFITKMGAILGSAGLSWAILLRPVKRFLAKKVEERRDSLARINRVLAELAPNGGASLRDAINRIEKTGLRLENRLRAYIDLNNDTGVFESKPNGECIFANKVLCDLLGLHPDQVVGNGWINGIHPEDRHRVWDSWSNAIHQRIEFTEKYRMVNEKTQVITLIKCQAVPLILDGVIQGWMGIVTVK